WVLHMLRWTLGERDFWRSIQHYVRRHQHQSVATADLVLAIEESTGRNLRSFFDRWVHQPGYPSFRVQYGFDEKAKLAKLWVQQIQHVSDAEPVFKLDVEVSFAGRGPRGGGPAWTRDFKKSVDGKDLRWEFSLPGEPLNVEFDPNHWILKKLDFRKPYPMWEHQLAHAKTALSRIQACHEVSKWGHPDAVRALRRAFDRERFWGAKAEFIAALGRVRNREAFEHVRELQSTPHPKVRRSAVAALAEFPANDVAGLAAKALKDPSIHVVCEAARVLGALKDSRQLPLVRAKLKERSYMDTIQTGAILGLSAAKDPALGPELRRCARPPFTYPARAYAVRGLSQLASADRRVLAWLAELLEDPDERVVLGVVSALGRTEDERALPALEALKGRTRNSRVKTYCDEAIARIKQGTDGPPKKKKR
ncbi:MAG: HEAT repeat domain-containing protein, partial [Elusimicrobia bacterium]|nr:HEAT repeat domain-containing protein [Elusimicrobiota bacterium]